MKHLNDYIFEAKTFSQVKGEVLKSLKISSWTTGISAKIGVQQIKPQNKMNTVPQYITYLSNDNYDKILIRPNFSYLKQSEYESKVLNSFNKLSSISGCSYQIISSKDELEEITKCKNCPSSEDYPMVIISVPKEGDTPELPGIPEGNKDDLPKTETPTEENKDKKIKFWCTGAGSMSVDYVAYGAMGDHWKPNFSRIQKHIGENKFTRYYTNLATKQFTSYRSLFNYLKKRWDDKYSEFSLVDEEQLIEASYDNRYYIKTF